MDLLLSDEQRLLQDSVGKLLTKEGGLKRTRGLRGKDGGFDRGIHEKMAEEGWFGLLVSPDNGGLGLGLTELALVLVEAGRQLAPEPVAAEAVSALILSEVDGSAQAALLEQVIAGKAIVMPAIEGDGGDGGKLRAQAAGTGVRLDGVCDGVPMAAACDGFLVSASGPDGARLAYVPRAAKGLAITSRPTVDGRPFARLSFESVAGDLLAAGEAGATAHRRLRDLQLFSAAAELVGVMSAALDMTVEYLKTRKQFGKPIGSFQALQHRAVGDYTRIVSSRSLLFQVAGQGTVSPMMAAALKAHAGGEALEVTKSAIQMHGAIGFTDECDIGLYLKRAMWLSAWLGNESHHRARYAAMQG